MYIDVIAPSSAPPKDFDTSLASDYLKHKGYELRMPSNLIGSGLPYHANTNETRYLHTLQALQNHDSKIIWCLKGGYGAAKVVEKLLDNNFHLAHDNTISQIKECKEGDAPIEIGEQRADDITFKNGNWYNKFQTNILIGFSDITALLLYCNQEFGWEVIHGSVLSHIGNKNFNPTNIDLIMELLNDFSTKQKFNNLNLISGNIPTSPIKGNITGGNLSVIASSIGTRWQIKTQGKILIIEDVNERSYRIDRMLHQLKSADLLNKVEAMICHFTYTDEPTGENYLSITLRDFAKQVDFPIFTYENIGHGYSNFPFVIGREAILEQNLVGDFSLTF